MIRGFYCGIILCMNESELKIRLFVSCHKAAKLIRDEVLTPIQLGAMGAKPIEKGMAKDSEGDNISELNPMYCEMTAQYWAWKNVDLDYYGFCHYRRYFNFSNKRFIEDEYGNIREKYPSDSMIEKYGLDADTISSLTKKYDVLISERKDLHRLAEPCSTVREHYEKAPHLHVEDFDTMVSIIDEKYPEYSDAAHVFSRGHTMCFCNMYILLIKYQPQRVIPAIPLR